MEPRNATPAMLKAGWGRIINVTTKLDTMNRLGTHPYGASKAALEMATEVWAKDAEGSGLTVNIVNPGAGANTPGMAVEMRDMSADGRAPKRCPPTRRPAAVFEGDRGQSSNQRNRMEVSGSTGFKLFLPAHGQRSTPAKRQHADQRSFLRTLFRSYQRWGNRLGISESLLWWTAAR